MDTASPLIVVAVALVDPGGKVLMQQRPSGKPMAGLWEFPGGKLEAGETPEAALVRECREELGIGIAAHDLVSAGFASAALEERHLLLLLFRCSCWQGTPAALHASALCWGSVAELAQLPMPAPDRPLLSQLAPGLST